MNSSERKYIGDLKLLQFIDSDCPDTFDGNILQEILNSLPRNMAIIDSYSKAYSVLCTHKYNKALCSISGGADSDLILDICVRMDIDKIIDYVWYDTGVEFNATKEHLKYLEDKYGIIIRRERPFKPVPIACKENGQPFLSKYVSEMISRLQLHGFKWEDKPFDVLKTEYQNCDSALRWWCDEKGEESKFGISRNKYLKEFMIKYPPTFQISNKCCNYAKKDISKRLIKQEGYDLIITGVRKAEGGVRAAAYKTCFSFGKQDNYRPIFWYNNNDKKIYEEYFNIQHSKCYTEYGLTRTGCAGCPYGRKLEQELNVCRCYEDKLYKAANNIFKDSYEYTKQYREYVRKHDGKPMQLKLSDFF